eukprot:364522-Chlamydomonas_euryale.AAC.7
MNKIHAAWHRFFFMPNLSQPRRTAAPNNPVRLSRQHAAQPRREHRCTPRRHADPTAAPIRPTLSHTRSMAAYKLSSASSTRTTPLRSVWIVTSTRCSLRVAEPRSRVRQGLAGRGMRHATFV